MSVSINREISAEALGRISKRIAREFVEKLLQNDPETSLKKLPFLGVFRKITRGVSEENLRNYHQSFPRSSQMVLQRNPQQHFERNFQQIFSKNRESMSMCRIIDILSRCL